MTKRLRWALGITGLLLCLSFEKPARSQSVRVTGTEGFLTMPAVSGYE